ncbi:hypothetical protein, partial [Salmonella enterica]
MKSINIAASCDIITLFSTQRYVVALESTDFTD